MLNKHAWNIIDSARLALPTACSSALWLLKLMVPISLAVTLMQYTGMLEWMAERLNPMFEHIGLPGASAVIFISGAMAGTYAGIAAMVSIHMTIRHATILAIMIGLCHALPMECAVNRKTGSSCWRMAVIRVFMAFLCAYCLNMLLPAMDGDYIYVGGGETASLQSVIVAWGYSQLIMGGLVFLIIYALMVLQRIIERYSWLVPLSRFLSPLMKVFGLPSEASYMWLVGNVLGISYGSAVMVDLETRGLVSKDDADEVNYHLIMNHSLLEDTIVFCLAGISALWLVASRVVCAMLVVWSRKVIKRIVWKHLKK